METLGWGGGWGEEGQILLGHHITTTGGAESAGPNAICQILNLVYNVCLSEAFKEGLNVDDSILKKYM